MKAHPAWTEKNSPWNGESVLKSCYILQNQFNTNASHFSWREFDKTLRLRAWNPWYNLKSYAWNKRVMHGTQIFCQETDILCGNTLLLFGKYAWFKCVTLGTKWFGQHSEVLCIKILLYLGSTVDIRESSLGWREITKKLSFRAWKHYYK